MIGIQPKVSLLMRRITLSVNSTKTLRLKRASLFPNKIKTRLKILNLTTKGKTTQKVRVPKERRARKTRDRANCK